MYLNARSFPTSVQQCSGLIGDVDDILPDVRDLFMPSRIASLGTVCMSSVSWQGLLLSYALV
ncbi:hypothetical protein BDQ17DRAFT_1373597 [Cyathus striatus]|nr:hypothetical protein BDQ17DRAFT_1373597 [Cyathus striatus]